MISPARTSEYNIPLPAIKKLERKNKIKKTGCNLLSTLWQKRVKEYQPNLNGFNRYL